MKEMKRNESVRGREWFTFLLGKEKEWEDKRKIEGKIRGVRGKWGNKREMGKIESINDDFDFIKILICHQ